MNKLIIIASLFILTSCDLVTYTVQNNHATDVEASGKGAHNNILIRSGECIEFLDIFGVYGDFPLEFSSKGKKSLGNDKDYKEGNYVINSDGTVTEVSDEKACVTTDSRHAKDDAGTEEPSAKPSQLTPPAKPSANKPSQLTPPAKPSANKPSQLTPPAKPSANKPSQLTPPASLKPNEKPPAKKPSGKPVGF